MTATDAVIIVTHARTQTHTNTRTHNLKHKTRTLMYLHAEIPIFNQ